MDTRSKKELDSTAIIGRYLVTGITAVWPSNDNFSMIFGIAANVREIRFKPTRTAGATDESVKVAFDADSEQAAENLLTYAPADPTTDPYPYFELTRDVWSDWFPFSLDEGLSPLNRVDFLSVTDTFTVEAEVR